MFKYLLLLFAFSALFANGTNETNSTKKISQYKITRKMKIYQQEKQQKEAEAKELEKDGFCPCSIQMP